MRPSLWSTHQIRQRIRRWRAGRRWSSGRASQRGVPADEPFDDAVSIVIAAYDAAATLGETLESVRAQTHQNWEVLVVDDGSRDDTARIAATWAARDPRIRYLRRPHLGVSATRNAGTVRASHGWLLFLDADDLLRPTMLERVLAVLRSDPGLDVAYCATARISNGTVWQQPIQFADPTLDPFETFGRACAVATDAMLLRREVIEDAGGFDTGLVTSEDWDLWQRISRAGARFGGTPEVLALYRVRPGSATLNPNRDPLSGLAVLASSHAYDPRVLHPLPQHVNGLPPAGATMPKAFYACWAAALFLGRGADARPVLARLLERLDVRTLPALGPEDVARILVHVSLLPEARPLDSAWAFWPAIAAPVQDFTTALEAVMPRPGFSAEVERRVHRLLIEYAPSRRPLTVGGTQACTVDLTRPIADLYLPAGIERVVCDSVVDGERLGGVELPVFDGCVPAAVLADALAAEVWWPLLGRHLARGVYPELRFRRGIRGVSVWRGGVCLARGLRREDVEQAGELHRHVGWVVFLQEVWGRADWSQDRFYAATTREPPAPARRAPVDGWLAVEVGNEPDVEATTPFNLLVAVAGSMIGVVPFAPSSPYIPAQALRAAIIRAASVDLARAVAREVLVGQDWDRPGTLRERLDTAAQSVRSRSPHADATLPGWPRLTAAAMRASDGTSVLVRHRADRTSAPPSAWRAALPSTVLPDLAMSAARHDDEQLLTVPGRGATDTHAPVSVVDLPWWPGNGTHELPTADGVSRPLRDRHEAEDSYARRDTGLEREQFGDPPWSEALFALLPAHDLRRALTLGCADGRLMARLAARTRRLVGAHLSRLALTRAATDSIDSANIRWLRCDVTQDPLPGRFDLILYTEAADRDLAATAAEIVGGKLIAALRPGAWLIVALPVATADPRSAAAVRLDAFLRAATALRPLRDAADSRYLLRAFKRLDGERQPHPTPAGGSVPTRRPRPPEPRPDRDLRPGIALGRPVSILRYPPVAPAGVAPPGSDQLSPEAFGQHLRALDQAGFYTVDLATWAAAQSRRKALPGRPLVLTFEDAEEEFARYAWPLLRETGLRAILCVTSDRAARAKSAASRPRPAAEWDLLRRLAADGVEIGSRGVTGRSLLALAPAEVAAEVARSRAALEEALRTPVRSLAYPYGATDRVVQRIVEACGYRFGLGNYGPTAENLLALPRITIAPTDDFRAVLRKLGVRVDLSGRPPDVEAEHLRGLGPGRGPDVRSAATVPPHSPP